MGKVISLKKNDWSTVSRRALTGPEIVTRLSKLEGWILTGEDASLAIEKSFDFPNYFQTMAFVNAVAFLSHTEDHHPELLIQSRRCVVRFNTHDVEGISITDFECAERCDALVARNPT